MFQIWTIIIDILKIINNSWFFSYFSQQTLKHARFEIYNSNRPIFFPTYSNHHYCGTIQIYSHTTSITCILGSLSNAIHRYHGPIKWPERMMSWTTPFCFTPVSCWCCFIFCNNWLYKYGQPTRYMMNLWSKKRRFIFNYSFFSKCISARQ